MFEYIGFVLELCKHLLDQVNCGICDFTYLQRTEKPGNVRISQLSRECQRIGFLLGECQEKNLVRKTVVFKEQNSIHQC